MATIRPFRGLRPPKALAAVVTARPYDVLSSDEARAEAEQNPYSLFQITRPEVNFPAGTSEHDPRVYDAAHEQMERFIKEGWLVQDDKPCYYVYAQTMNDHTQYGLMVAASVEDYRNEVIKRHELTRRDKEDDRMRHVDATNANLGSAFFAYPHRDDLDAIIADIVKAEPEYDFVTKEEGFRHQLWPVSDEQICAQITAIFAEIPTLYIADGHHRTAAAARVGAERMVQNKKNHTGEEEYNFFLATCFPDNQLTVLDYNRVVRDLNGYTPDEVLDKLMENFFVEKIGPTIYKPSCLHEFSLYMGGNWFKLKAKPGTFAENDPIESLDVAISSKHILNEILGITDLRSDKRIDFVGGIRGLEELQKRVDSGEMELALALYPVSMQQIFDVADTGNIMPPKATWFEPKLRSGIVIHTLD